MTFALFAQTKPPTASFAALSKRADETRDANRIEEAVGLYKRALALRPNWQDGWWSLGTLEYDRDHYALAARDFEKLLRLSPKNGSAHVMLGLCQFELGKDGESLTNLRAGERYGILKDEQLRNVALFHLGVLQLRIRRFGDAQDSLQELAKQQIRTRELILALGQASLLLTPQDYAHKGPDAEQLVARVGETRLWSAAKDFTRAKRTFTDLTTQFPDFPNLHFAYGRLLLDSHETDEAIKQFQRELERDPNHVNSMLEIASVQYQSESDAGLAYAEKAVKIAPQLPFAHYMLGLLRLDTGDAAGAIPEMEAAKKFFPHQPKVYFSLGNAYAKVGRKADAVKARAEFVRLQALADSRESNIYNDLPSGVSEQQMRSVERTPPPQ